MTTSQQPRMVRSVERAIDILEYLARSGRPMSLAEIFRAVNAPKSTTLNVVRTLVRRRILERDAETKKYRAGALLLALAGSAGEAVDLAGFIRPYLERLVEKTGETVLLAVIEQDELVYLDAVNSPQPIRYVAHIGMRRLLHGTSGGKLFLALKGEEAWEAYLVRVGLPKYTSTTYIDPDKFRQHLRRIREDGYAISEGETVPDVIGLAVPLFEGDGGKFVGVIILAAPAFRGRKSVKQHLRQLLAAAQAVSRDLGLKSSEDASLKRRLADQRRASLVYPSPETSLVAE